VLTTTTTTSASTRSFPLLAHEGTKVYERACITFTRARRCGELVICVHKHHRCQCGLQAYVPTHPECSLGASCTKQCSSSAILKRVSSNSIFCSIRFAAEARREISNCSLNYHQTNVTSNISKLLRNQAYSAPSCRLSTTEPHQISHSSRMSETAQRSIPTSSPSSQATSRWESAASSPSSQTCTARTSYSTAGDPCRS